MSIYQHIRAVGLAVLLAAPLSIGAASAQELSADHLSAARKAMTAAEATDRYDGILPTLSNRVKSTLISSRPDLSDQISALVDIQALALAVRRGDLEKEAARTFANAFTVEELNAITAFYNSDAGKKFLREAPVLTRKLTESAKIWEAGMFRDLTVKVAAEMEAQGLDK